MPTIFDIITDPTRRRILDLLLERPHSVGELVELLDISQPGVSKQLRLLRETGLVEVRKDGQLRWYQLNPEPLQELDAWLAAYRRLWGTRYDRLDAYLKTYQAKAEEIKNQDE